MMHPEFILRLAAVQPLYERKASSNGGAHANREDRMQTRQIAFEVVQRARFMAETQKKTPLQIQDALAEGEIYVSLSMIKDWLRYKSRKEK